MSLRQNRTTHPRGRRPAATAALFVGLTMALLTTGVASADVPGNSVQATAAAASPDDIVNSVQATAAAASPDDAVNSVQATASVSPNYTAGCYAKATKPTQLKAGGQDLYSETALTYCFGNPDLCRWGNVLRQYNGNNKSWTTLNYKLTGWRSCKLGRNVQSNYHCTYDPTTQWWYQATAIVQIQKNGIISSPGYAAGPGASYWCR